MFKKSKKTEEFIDESKMQPRIMSYSEISKVRITCKCGAVCITSNVEYFCPQCGLNLVEPIRTGSFGLTHHVFDYSRYY